MEKTNKTKTNFRVQLAIFNEPEKNNIQYIGINPKLSETLVNNALLNNCFHNLKYIKKIGREKKILNSRFDFIGVDKNDRSFILEVKAVPLADYDDIYAKRSIQWCARRSHWPGAGLVAGLANEQHYRAVWHSAGAVSRRQWYSGRCTLVSGPVLYPVFLVTVFSGQFVSGVPRYADHAGGSITKRLDQSV